MPTPWTLRLPDDVKQRLSEIARSERRSMAAQAIRYIEQGLDRDVATNRNEPEPLRAA